MKSKKRGKVGLALSGGTVAGFSHIGILEAFDKHDIKISHIAGTSMGAIIGAFYAAGIKPKEIKKIALETNYIDLLDFTLPREGLLIGKKFGDFVKGVIGNKNFSDLNIPLAITATDLKSNKNIIFDKGNVVEAIRASISLPGIFVPHKYKNMELVDGGFTEPIPINAVRKLGAKKVIAVYTSIKPSIRIKDHYGVSGEEFRESFIEQELKNFKKYLNKKIKIPKILLKIIKPYRVENLLMNHKLGLPKITTIGYDAFFITHRQFSKMVIEKEKPDLVLMPKFRNMGFLDFSKVGYAIHRGEVEAKENIRKVINLAKK